MTREISVHDWKQLKGERIPRFPSPIGEKRGIGVEISTWKGVSIGAKHYYVEIKEQENSWWCEEENAWSDITSARKL